jgi:MHS family proline/betaine transporter-like MFS transporter
MAADVDGACLLAYRITASFYVGYSYLPTLFNSQANIPTQTTLWMVLSCMVLYTAIIPVSAYFADRGMPRLRACMAANLLSAATAIPMFMAFQTKSLAACWVLQAYTLGLAAFCMGMLPAIIAQIFPAAVRATGMNVVYNVSVTVFGGTTPLAITAIQASTGQVFKPPAIWLITMAALSFICSFVLMRMFPKADASPSEDSSLPVES